MLTKLKVRVITYYRNYNQIYKINFSKTMNKQYNLNQSLLKILLKTTL